MKVSMRFSGKIFLGEVIFWSCEVLNLSHLSLSICPIIEQCPQEKQLKNDSKPMIAFSGAIVIKIVFLLPHPRSLKK